MVFSLRFALRRFVSVCQFPAERPVVAGSTQINTVINVQVLEHSSPTTNSLQGYVSARDNVSGFDYERDRSRLADLELDHLPGVMFYATNSTKQTVKMNNTINSIMIIEDRAADLDLTKRALKRRNVLNPVIEARDGEEALSYIDRWDAGEPVPLVILLDLKLPKVSGLDVLRKLKAHPTYCSIPVVVLTTSSEDLDVQTAYKLGCNSYIIKPVEFEKFMEVASQVEIYWCGLNQTMTPK